MQRQESKNGKGVSGKKVFLYTLAAGALVGGAYLTYDYLRKRNEDQGADEVTTTISTSTTNTSIRPSLPASSGNDNFPLRKGSRGTRVVLLQQALEKILGAATLAQYTKIDGVFGSGTQSALQAAGYGKSIDEVTFSRLTGTVTNSIATSSTPKDKASQLYTGAVTRNIEGVVAVLSQMRSTSDYSAVNEAYKALTESKTMVTKTIVTDLLDFAFKYDEAAKQRIKAELLRMGLKLDAVSGRWSLSGFNPKKDVVTVQLTLVTDSKGRKFPVKRNTILGEELGRYNGMCRFRSVDGVIHEVPAKDVAYVK